MYIRNGKTYEQWCQEVTWHAEKTTDGLICFRNVTFNYADRFKDGDPIATSADQLVVAAQKAITELFNRPLFKAAA